MDPKIKRKIYLHNSNQALSKAYMSENSAKIDELLRNCETAVQDVIAAAARDSDYETVGRGREVALRLSALRSNPSGNVHEQQRWHTSQIARSLLGQAKPVRGSRSQGYPRFELIDN